ncbi:MAG: phosphotransferase [Propionibacteriaceae bacterium]|nr:phosphotransferase [Propionibacteriaceae bacterium]
MEIRELWKGYLPKARWFAAKGLSWQGFELKALQWYAHGEVSVRSELAYVKLPEHTEVYHLLVGYLPAGSAEPAALLGQTRLDQQLVDVVDAPLSATAMRAFLGGIAQPGVSGVEWLGTPPAADLPVKVFGGEQSNTSISIGDVLLKLFRKLPEGQNLETEMLRDLADSSVTPKLIGTITTADQEYELGIFCERIPDATDGWSYATTACRENRPITAELRQLGCDLRVLHGLLAGVYGTATISAGTVSTAMLTRLDEAAENVPELLPLADALSAVLRLPPGELKVQRVHGDFHLGQVLRSPRGWTFIDFEGEPLKTMAERKAPDAVWRDVAGLTRSLDYARFSHSDPGGAQAQDWYAKARAAFLDGYLDKAGVPAALHAYEVDKAIYELVYETRNRPDWAEIPRQAVRAAASAA